MDWLCLRENLVSLVCKLVFIVLNVNIDVSLELGGRRMIVLPALGKRDVENLKESKKEKDEENVPKNQNTLEYWIHNDKHKKRNIYLAKSGLNDPNDVSLSNFNP